MAKPELDKKTQIGSNSAGTNSHNPSDKKRKARRSDRDVASSASSKKTTITLALDDFIVKELRKEAERDKSSINSKVNSILEKYLGFYKYVELLHSVIIPQTQMQKMLEIMDEVKLTEIMKTYGNANVLSVFTNMGVSPTLTGLIKYHFSRSILWSGPYDAFNYYIDNEGYPCLVFEHKFGIKWSRILAETTSEMIRLILGCPIERKVMPSTLVIRIMDRDTGLDEK